jgi:hypothetical protein
METLDLISIRGRKIHDDGNKSIFQKIRQLQTIVAAVVAVICNTT